jgi:hypothetical protein
LTPFAEKVFDVLGRYTAFPWPIMLAQCKRANVDPAMLRASDLPKVLDFIVEAVERFTSPEKARAVRTELQQLAERAPP